jgi:hypothetical protein
MRAWPGAQFIQWLVWRNADTCIHLSFRSRPAARGGRVEALFGDFERSTEDDRHSQPKIGELRRRLRLAWIPQWFH